MEVITERPIYNYADGGDGFSYLTREERKAKRQKSQRDPNDPNWYQKAISGTKTAIESDWGKALVGVTAQKAQNWASTGSGMGAGTGTFNAPIDYQPLPSITDSSGSKGAGGGMGIWTKVAIGVGIVTVLGVATYFILKSKKGKTSKK
jgi:hypothetical protein